MEEVRKDLSLLENFVLLNFGYVRPFENIWRTKLSLFIVAGDGIT